MRCLIVGVLVLLGVSALADSIVLKDGRKLDGEIVEETATHVRFRMKSAVVSFKREEVVEMTRTASPGAGGASDASGSGENSAAKFREVFAGFPLFDRALDKAMLAACREPWTGGDPKITEALDANASSIRKLISLGDTSACRFLEGVTVQPSTPLDHLSFCRRISRLLVVAGRRDFAEGRVDAAMESWLTALRLVQIAENDRIGVSRMIAATVTECVVPALVDLIRSGKCGSKGMSAIGTAITAIRQRRLPWSTVVEEDARQLVAIAKEMYRDGADLRWLAQEGNPELKVWGQEIGAMDAAARAAQYQEVCAIVADFARRYSAAAVAGHLGDLAGLDREAAGGPNGGSSLTARIFQVMVFPQSLTLLRVVTADASLALCEVGAALARYRQEKGGVPDRLAALVPTYLPMLPVDPFDARPLRYAKNGDACTVWSIGPDLKDDGGARVHDPAASKPDGDLVWVTP